MERKRIGELIELLQVSAAGAGVQFGGKGYKGLMAALQKSLKT